MELQHYFLMYFERQVFFTEEVQSYAGVHVWSVLLESVVHICFSQNGNVKITS